MITASDIQVIKDTADNAPVTREMLQYMGFELCTDWYSFSRVVQFKKDRIVLTEYKAETNSAVLKPYEKCYSCKISWYHRDINYCIYTVKQLKLFLESYEKIQQIKAQAEIEVNKIADSLTSTLLQK